VQFADIILPLNLPGALTYGVPLQWQDSLQPGMRVEVSLGKNKLYSGVVLQLHDNRPETFAVKPIRSIIDDSPVVLEKQLHFWEWVSAYYLCGLGEVMQAALPAHLKLMNETLLVWNDALVTIPEQLSDEGFLIAEALEVRKKLTLREVRELLDNQNPAAVIQELLHTETAFVTEVLEERYKPKKIRCVLLNPAYDDELKLQELFTRLKPYSGQMKALMAFLHLRQQEPVVSHESLIKKESVSTSSLNTLIKNDILISTYREADRLFDDTPKTPQHYELNEAQSNALQTIQEQWKTHQVVLLQGITGSGKTLLYISLIKSALAKDQQVLLLLPEIALTTQIVSRLKHYFGEELGVYHSRFNNNERVEIWNKVKSGSYKIILGPRSALWLPFQNLAHIIIDEEHDTSYKQQDPAPRFQARDAAIYLAKLHDAKVLLGSATPSLESLYNVQIKKYGYASLQQRYQNVASPEIEIVSAKNYQAALSNIITTPLLEAVTQTLRAGRQVIFFQNKRGYAPFLLCTGCGWVPHCKDCDVSLTYHKTSDKLHCHYCGNRSAPVLYCPQCGNKHLVAKSFGTEKIEEELQRIFPKIRTARMDWDSVKGKNQHARLIEDFTRGRIDILVGTQMVVKGLDFDNVGLVGILSADSLLSYPNFRVNERAFQLMLQVSGRAGRSDGIGKVIIQAHNQKHPVLEWVQNNNFRDFYHTELSTRQHFQYPPFVKFVKIICKHREELKNTTAAKQLLERLSQIENIQLRGPVPALIPRIRNFYLQEIWLKLPVHAGALQKCKQAIAIAIQETLHIRGNSALQIIVDVDAY